MESPFVEPECDIMTPENILEAIKNHAPAKVFVYDSEFLSYDYVTGVRIDKDGDLIIEIGGDA
jgi:hypothetical protein